MKVIITCNCNNETDSNPEAYHDLFDVIVCIIVISDKTGVDHVVKNMLVIS